MITPEKRRGLLLESLKNKDMVRIIEAHSGLSALIGDSAQFRSDIGVLEFDGLWDSSLTDSAIK